MCEIGTKAMKQTVEENYRSTIRRRLRTAQRLCCHVSNISVAGRLQLIRSALERPFLVCFHKRQKNLLMTSGWNEEHCNISLVFVRPNFSNCEPARLEQQTIPSDSGGNYSRANYHIVWLLFLPDSPLWNGLTHDIRNLLIWLPGGAGARGSHAASQRLSESWKQSFFLFFFPLAVKRRYRRRRDVMCCCGGGGAVMEGVSGDGGKCK